MDLTKIGLEDVDWMHLVQDRDQRRAIVNTVMNLRGSIKQGESLEQLCDYYLLKKDSAPWS
jgi:hypothetical protein